MSCPTCAEILQADEDGGLLGKVRPYLPYIVVAVAVLAGLYLLLRRR